MKKLFIITANIWLFVSSLSLLILSSLPFTVYLAKGEWPFWVHDSPETWSVFALFAISALFGFWLLFLSMRKGIFKWVLINTLIVIEGLSLIINYYMKEASIFTAVIALVPLLIAGSLYIKRKSWFE